MDTIQKHVYDDCSAFVGERFEHYEHETHISISQREAYVIMKAFEDQQRYLNPVMVIKE